MMRLLPNDQRRAALSAGLLASEHDGEVVAAARALVGLLKKGDLEPADVVSAGLKSVTTSPIPAPPLHWWSVAQSCACYLDQLNDVERQFVINMAHRNTRPSEKQEAWLGRIHDDLNRKAV